MAATAFTPLTALGGGALIGASAVLLLGVSGRIAGISGIIGRALLPDSKSRPLEALSFLVGLAAAPLLWLKALGLPIEQTVSSNIPLLAVGGLIVGFGAALGNGCTSGHGVCGLSRLSERSIAATLTFMFVAAVTVYVTRHILAV